MSSSSNSSSSDSPLHSAQQTSGSIPMFSPYISCTTSNALKIKAPPQQNISTPISNLPINPYISNQNINISNPQDLEIKLKSHGFVIDSSKTPINGPVFPPKLASQIPNSSSNEPMKPLQIPTKMPFQVTPPGMRSDCVKIPPYIIPDKLGQPIKPPQSPLMQSNPTIFTAEKTENIDKNPENVEKDTKISCPPNMAPPSLLLPFPFKTNSNAVPNKNFSSPPNLLPKKLPPPEPSQPPPLNPQGLVLKNPRLLGNPPPSLLSKTNSNNDKAFSQPGSQSNNNPPPSLLIPKNQVPTILNPTIPTSQHCLINRAPAFPIEKIPVPMIQEQKNPTFPKSQPCFINIAPAFPIEKTPVPMIQERKNQADDYKKVDEKGKNLENPPVKKDNSKPPPLKIKSQNQSLQLDPDKDIKTSQNPQSDLKMHNFNSATPKTDSQNLTPNNKKTHQKLNEMVFSGNNSLNLQKAPDFESNSSISQNDSGLLVVGRDINSLTLHYLDIKICFLCKSNENVVSLKCEHVLCENCLQKTVETAAEKHLFHSGKTKIYPLCPCCRKNIHQELFLDAFYYKNLISNCIERYRNTLFRTKTCFSCKKAYNLTRFFKKPKCQHQCKECLATEINLAKEKCPFCPEKYDLYDLINARERCSCCREEKLYVKDCIFSICNEHYHCLKCLQNALCSRKCGKCDRNVGKEDFFRVFQRLKRFKEQFS